MATKSSIKSAKKGSKSTKTSTKKKSSKSTVSKGKNVASAAPASFRKQEVARNGLRSFAFHSGDKGAGAVLGAIRPQVSRPRAGAARPSAAAARASVTALDAESAARHYLNNALASEKLPTFTAGGPDGEKSDFKLIAVEAVTLTGTQMVKFCQYYRRTPVYGSLVAVELDKKNGLVSINSTLTEPTGVDAVASVAPAEVLKTVAQLSGQDPESIKATPNVYYYFDRDAQRWRLVYITRDVPKRKGSGGDIEDSTAGVSNRRTQSFRVPQAFDYVVDAHSGELVAELPRSHSATVKAFDGLKKLRNIGFSQNTTGNVLHDADLNLHTFDFGFGNVDAQTSKLPGDYVANPPEPWDGAAVSAHANAADVMKFFSTVLKRNGIDDMGGAVKSTINCVEEDETQEWDNAMWHMNQMMYGQSRVNDKLRSWALAKDIVAHELTHGITDFTARIEYKGESGALNESYADIMGLIVANIGEPDVKKWNWLIGEGLFGRGTALRDMRKPEKFDQPSHMADFKKIHKNDDFGGVHTNSGIHNKVAHNMLTAKDPAGRYLLKPREVAALFYLALTQSLSRTSRFSDSRRGVELAARSFFANKTNKQARFKAVAKAFDKVGIV